MRGGVSSIARDAQPRHEIAVVVGLVPHAGATRRLAASREQQPAARGGIRPTSGNPGAPELPRRPERVRKQDAEVEPLRLERGHRVARRRGQLDHPIGADVGVFAEERRHRRRRRDGQMRRRKMPADRRHRRQRQHRVSEPVRRTQHQTLDARGVGDGHSGASLSSGAGAGNMSRTSSVAPDGKSRHRRCIHNHRCGWRRTYISSTSLQRCDSSRTGSGDPAGGNSTGCS